MARRWPRNPLSGLSRGGRRPLGWLGRSGLRIENVHEAQIVRDWLNYEVWFQGTWPGRFLFLDRPEAGSQQAFDPRVYENATASVADSDSPMNRCVWASV
jgi:hypothetical protein